MSEEIRTQLQGFCWNLAEPAAGCVAKLAVYTPLQVQRILRSGALICPKVAGNLLFHGGNRFQLILHVRAMLNGERWVVGARGEVDDLQGLVTYRRLCTTVT